MVHLEIDVDAMETRMEDAAGILHSSLHVSSFAQWLFLESCSEHIILVLTCVLISGCLFHPTSHLLCFVVLPSKQL